MYSNLPHMNENISIILCPSISTTFDYITSIITKYLPLIKLPYYPIIYNKYIQGSILVSLSTIINNSFGYL